MALYGYDVRDELIDRAFSFAFRVLPLLVALFIGYKMGERLSNVANAGRTPTCSDFERWAIAMRIANEYENAPVTAEQLRIERESLADVANCEWGE